MKVALIIDGLERQIYKMDCQKCEQFIIGWLKDRIKEAGLQGFVVGVSGGIDSAVVSTLCSMTGFPTNIVYMPILQGEAQAQCAIAQTAWLKKWFENVIAYTVDLTSAFEGMKSVLPTEGKSELALANCRSRLRMSALYSIANGKGCFVVGTGNKVEDFGIGFFTKYGDGGVDLSPIGDLLKSEVYELGAHLGIPEDVQKATPTDGLFDDGRSDEDQIGVSYADIEWAMNYCERTGLGVVTDVNNISGLTEEQIKSLRIFLSRHNMNSHKMKMPAICVLTGIK
jgi:NAD+ synthase